MHAPGQSGAIEAARAWTACEIAVRVDAGGARVAAAVGQRTFIDIEAYNGASNRRIQRTRRTGRTQYGTATGGIDHGTVGVVVATAIVDRTLIDQGAATVSRAHVTCGTRSAGMADRCIRTCCTD